MNQIIDTFSTNTNRDKILLAGFNEMHMHGYQGMRIEAILNSTGLAKGALYHHFPNKLTLAYAIIDEILFTHAKKLFESIVEKYDDPIEANCRVFSDFCSDASEEQIALGCPLNNLCQEMSGLDDGFKDRLSNIYQAWLDLIDNSLARGQKTGFVDPTINTTETAMFLLCSYQGIIGAAKCMQSKELLVSQSKMLCAYIQGLRN